MVPTVLPISRTNNQEVVDETLTHLRNIQHSQPISVPANQFEQMEHLLRAHHDYQLRNNEVMLTSMMNTMSEVFNTMTTQLVQSLGSVLNQQFRNTEQVIATAARQPANNTTMRLPVNMLHNLTRTMRQLATTLSFIYLEHFGVEIRFLTRNAT